MPNYYSRSIEDGSKFGFHEEDKTERWQTDVEEVWFAGCHGGTYYPPQITIVFIGPIDVGGGYVKNGERFCLARIPLRWMIRECFATNTGIQFYSGMLKQMGIDPTTLHPKVTPRPQAIYSHTRETDPTHPFVSEEHEDLFDALSGMHDQLLLRPFWWILELLPQEQEYQDANNKWKTRMKYVFHDFLIFRLMVSFFDYTLGRIWARGVPFRNRTKL